MDISVCCNFVKRKLGNIVYKDMISVASVEFIIFYLVGSSIDAKFTVFVRFGLLIGLGFFC